MRITPYMAIALSSLTLLGSCSHLNGAKLANEIAIPATSIAGITISYDEEKITFFENENDENIIIQEYMTKDSRHYYAKVDREAGNVKISKGGKPFFKDGFYRYIEVYIPSSLQGNLSITTTDGDIDISRIPLDLISLSIDTSHGTVDLKDVRARGIVLSTTHGCFNAERLEASSIKVDSTSGTFQCDWLIGDVTYTSTSGNANIASAVGKGQYTANNSGELRVVYKEVTGDLFLFNKNDDIDLTLPSDLEFEFEATTKNGSISTNFQGCISIDGRTTRGTIGSSPTVSVEVMTNNGNIEVRK